jgi:hypothetical protein
VLENCQYIYGHDKLSLVKREAGIRTMPSPVPPHAKAHVAAEYRAHCYIRVAKSR